MNNTNRAADFLAVGKNLLQWYEVNSRDLPWRETKDPYKIWICEIVLQQTRVEQGKNHYLNFIKRFPDVHTLASSHTDEVLLYWKGLGYYSRAINLHTAAQQIVNGFNGVFPSTYEDLLKLKGVGKYTAAAIASISFGEKIPAVDGNFYRVLSRIFADGFDISSSQAHRYFHELALRIMPEEDPGHFNQSMMDLGSEICMPKNPLCQECPVNSHCAAFATGTVSQFPVKTKKVKTASLLLHYYFVQYGDTFLVNQRDDSFIWKRLFDFPQHIPQNFEKYITNEETVQHKLTHKNLEINFRTILLESEKKFVDFAAQNGYRIMNYADSHEKSFPKPLENFLKKVFGLS